MKTYLYLDTTDHLILGILQNNAWLNYQDIPDKKNSGKLHKTIYDLMKKFDISFRDLDGLIVAAGPGSYTGMRLSDGLAQTLSWQNIKTFAFYHFEIPEILGLNEAYFVSDAFKGEVFVGKCDNNKFEWRLQSPESWSATQSELLAKQTPIFNLEQTTKLIMESPEKIFPRVIANNHIKAPFYYRTPEEEYRQK